MTNLPKLRTKYGEGVGVELFFQFPDISDNEKTYLDADSTSGSSTLTANGTNFSIDQYILIGNPGQEHTEIIKIHASTSPTSTAITLASTTSFAHNRGDLIRFIPYNQIIPERATGGAYSALSAINIRPDASETYLQRTGDASTDTYKFRFYNSTSTLYSSYSDITTASGYADNSVHSIKKRTLRGMNEQIGELVTDQFLNESLWEGRRELDQDKRIKRWSFRTKFNTDIGNIIPGSYSLTVPTDLRDPNTNSNILSLKIGRNNRSLEYQDIQRFNENYRNIAHTTLGSAISTTGDLTITLTSSGDFDESGDVIVAAETISQTLDTVSYTANAETTGVLSGVTGIAATKSAGIDVWQGGNFGEPSAYTIYGGKIYFDIPFSDDLAGENIYMDYYSELPAYDSDADTLDEPEYDMFVSFLRWKIKYLKSGGKLDRDTDTDHKEWIARKDDLITKEYTGQEIRLEPDIL
jgi:hypothetical protein